MEQNKIEVINMINSSEYFLKFFYNKDMILMYPFIQTIKVILSSEKPYEKGIGKKISYFFEYEINNENSIYKKNERNVLLRMFENIDNAEIWNDFVSLFNLANLFDKTNDFFHFVEGWMARCSVNVIL